jgi:hypothetical protein
VRAGQIAFDGEAWPAKAWLVIAVWTLVVTRMAARAWQRDTERT